MGQIVQFGSVNTAALNVPQVLVQIVPPPYLYGGAQTNIGGVVGVATWGPVNAPVAYGNVAQGALVFGQTVNRLYDIMGASILAFAQGSTFLYGVRVTDGTDAAATIAVASTAALSATGTFTETSTNNFINNDALQIGSVTYTFQSALTNVAGHVLLGANFALSAANLLAAITLGAGAGTTYAAATVANTSATATSTATTIAVSALTPGTAGNSVPTVYTAAGTSAGTFGAAALSGGAAAIVGITLSGFYTGSTGNGIKATISSGTKASSFKLILSLPGYPIEVFDNITGTGNALWVAMAAAVNSGQSTARGPSALCTATAGAGTVLPSTSAATYSLSSGTDGATTITTSVLLGQDSLPRKGMYCLRNTNVSKAMIADLSDTTSFSTQDAFGLDIACEMIVCTPAGDTISSAATELSVAGVDSYSTTCMFGDWIYFIDTVNNVPMRLISPQSCKLGILCALSPQNSPLNKRINGIVGTQKSLTKTPYSSSDLQLLATARMDVIGMNPQVGTQYFNCLFGVNTSSNPVISGDEYTQMVYFLARSLFTIGGPYVGQVHTPDLETAFKTSIYQFLAGISVPVSQNGPGMLSTLSGGQPYSVTVDSTNNTQASAALGFLNAAVQCVFGPIARYVVINLQGGSSVVITTAPASQNATAIN